MDWAGVTVKEAWVKAKVVCRKKGVRMVLSPLPFPPPPQYSHTIGACSCRQPEASTQHWQQKPIKVLPLEIGAVLANKISMFLAD